MSTDFEPRRAKPGETFEFADTTGTLHHFSADENGVVHPKNAQEVAVCDSRDLPVARKALAQAKGTAGDGGKE